MSRDTFEWIYLLALLSLLGWTCFVQIRNLLRRHRSKNWPTIDATVQTGALGGIFFGKGASAAATFVGYAFDLHRRLAGSVIPIRYDPSDPNISFLVESADPRFGGLAVAQNPEYLSQSPAFDLQDALR
jgi:hypothetical protein